MRGGQPAGGGGGGGGAAERDWLQLELTDALLAYSKAL